MKVNLDNGDIASQRRWGTSAEKQEDMGAIGKRSEEGWGLTSVESSTGAIGRDEVPGDVAVAARASGTKFTENSEGGSPAKAELEPYILRAHGTTDKIFHTSFGHDPPMLRNDRLNRIILYSGGFNPPHKGHLELVRNAMFNSSADLNIIASILCPRDDKFVHSKTNVATSPYKFTKAQRVRLLKSEPRNWFWVYDQDDDDCPYFQGRLRDYAKIDGFDVEFVSLIGPDYVSVRRTLNYQPNGCDEVIVSDSSRSVDFLKRVSGELKFTDLTGYTSWKKADIEKEYLATLIKERPEILSRDMRTLHTAQAVALIMQDPDILEARKQLSLEDMINIGERNWICHNRKHTKRSIRFIPRELTREEISSTQVREILTKHARDYGMLLNKLRPLVLSMRLLLEFVMEIDSLFPF